MTPSEKKQAAVDFINGVRAMTPKELNDLICLEAGDELGSFFLNYSATLIQKEPSRILENTSALMLMGYLIRASEEKTAPKATTWTPTIGQA